MKAVTALFSDPSNVRTLADIMKTEICDNRTNVAKYKDWSAIDQRIAVMILNLEADIINQTHELDATQDSLKGEKAMKDAYPSFDEKKATDSITMIADGVLVLTEAKYLYRFGGKGPFGGRGSFKQRISGKFLEMAESMVPDGETISPLRVIVVSEPQLPFSINHVHSLIESNDTSGSYSEDGKEYEYVLCSSKSLRMIVDNPTMPRVSTDDYFFFTL